MITAKQAKKMKDHNGLPIVFSEYGESDILSGNFSTRCRFIVEPTCINGKIGYIGPKSGRRVVWEFAGRYNLDILVSCRSGERVQHPFSFPGSVFPKEYNPFIWLTTGETMP